MQLQIRLNPCLVSKFKSLVESTPESQSRRLTKPSELWNAQVTRSQGDNQHKEFYITQEHKVEHKSASHPGFDPLLIIQNQITCFFWKSKNQKISSSDFCKNFKLSWNNWQVCRRLFDWSLDFLRTPILYQNWFLVFIWEVWQYISELMLRFLRTTVIYLRRAMLITTSNLVPFLITAPTLVLMLFCLLYNKTSVGCSWPIFSKFIVPKKVFQ